MSKQILILVSLSFLALTVPANADYITPVENVDIGKGVLARAYAATEINDRNITDEVIELFNRPIADMSKGITLVTSDDNRIYLYLNTRGGTKNFINQIIIEEEV